MVYKFLWFFLTLSFGFFCFAKSSLTVLMVDSLGFEDLVCQKDWCYDFTKFSQAYTPSTFSQAVVVSLMTGKYPFENHVWHNGDQFLSSEVETLAEKAVLKGFRTSFFSGGVPIFKKAGLQQGFEVFQDQPDISKNEIYIPAQKNFQQFFYWLEQEVSSKEFFVTFIYLSDLQFGESKQNLIQKIEAMVIKLKKIRPDSFVILLGLQGKGLPYNLKASKTRVPLWIKSTYKKKSITDLVSLVDLGETFYDLLGLPKSPKNLLKELPIYSLKPLLKEKSAPQFQGRKILMESSWTQWKHKSRSRFAVRKDSYLFLWDQKPKLFQSELLVKNKMVSQELTNFFRNLSLDPWTFKHEKETQLSKSWEAQRNLEKQKWQALLQSHRPEWRLVGAKNLNKDFLIPVKSCLNLFFPKHEKNFKSCNDDLLKKTFVWVKKRKPSHFRSFFKTYWYKKVYQEIMKWDRKNHFQWDIRQVDVPLWADLYLALPQNKQFLKQVQLEMNKTRNE